MIFAIPIVAGIGNALLAVPMVRQIKRKLPGARVVVLARTGAMGEVFARLGEVDEVRRLGGGSVGMFRSMRQLARERPEAFLVPFPSNRLQYMALATASGARRRVLHSYPIGTVRTLRFLPAQFVPAVRGRHDVLSNLDLLGAIGIEPDFSARPEFPVNEDDRDRASDLLRSAGVDADAHPIVIHAGSATTILARAKRWPPALFAELIGRLAEQYTAPILILEGPDEPGVASEILSHRKGSAKPLHLAGPLATTAAVLERARLYVGTDSGLAHLAAAVGTPPVTLFAPADPDRVCPYGYRDLVVQPKCDCCPSLLYPFESTRPRLKNIASACIATISPEQVMAAVKTGLAWADRGAQ